MYLGAEAGPGADLAEIDAQVRHGHGPPGTGVDRDLDPRNHDDPELAVGGVDLVQQEADGVDLQLTAWMLAFRCPVSGEKVEYRLS